MYGTFWSGFREVRVQHVSLLIVWYSLEWVQECEGAVDFFGLLRSSLGRV